MDTDSSALQVIGYIRVSPEEQAASGAGLDAQRAAITAEADRRGWQLTKIFDAQRSGIGSPPQATERAAARHIGHLRARVPLGLEALGASDRQLWLLT